LREYINENNLKDMECDKCKTTINNYKELTIEEIIEIGLKIPPLPKKTNMGVVEKYYSYFKCPNPECLKETYVLNERINDFHIPELK
jgi:hypothetical protein